MHVMIIPADRGGCGYYRLIWPGEAVSSARPGWTVTIVPPERVQTNHRTGAIAGMPDPLPDVLVMQRIGTPAQLHVFKWAKDQGIATVLDFDDAMWCIHEDNYAWPAWNRDNELGQHWRICEEAAKVADLITVTTPALEKHYGRYHYRTEVIPNFVPRRATETTGHERNEVFTAGWCGYTKTHPGDCTVSAPAAQTVLDDGGALRVIADAEGAAKEWGIDPSRVDAVPPQKFGEKYYQALSALDLMLVGLQDSKFNQAKSFLKVIEAAAAGVPSIAPNNAPHRALAKQGFPVFLAESPSDWADIAKQVKHQWEHAEPYRTREELRQIVRDHWTTEGNAYRWADAWERARRISA